MPVTKTQPGYSLEQVENDLATLRGQVDMLKELIAGKDIQLTGAITAVVSGVAEAPKSLSPGNGWSGSLRYWKNANNTVHLSINLTAGSPANNVTIATLP